MREFYEVQWYDPLKTFHSIRNFEDFAMTARILMAVVLSSIAGLAWAQDGSSVIDGGVKVTKIERSGFKAV